jgi:Zn-dependent protease with chaperone function
MALLVEGALALFRLKSFRRRAMLRLLPFLNVAIDFFWNRFSTGNVLNPLHCDSCVQKTLLTLFSPELKTFLSTHQTSLSNHLASFTPSFFFTVTTFLIGTTTSFFVLKKVVTTLSCCRLLNRWIQNSKPCHRPIANPLLSQTLERLKVRLLVCDQIEVPTAAYFKTILFPKHQIDAFSEKEWEAVIAHELEHLRWKDPFVRLVCHAMSAFFWWIPMKGWLKRLEQTQEMACDAGTAHYHIEKEALASALLTAQKSTQRKENFACFLASTEGGSLSRMRQILFPKFNREKLSWRTIAIISGGSTLIASCLM